MRCNFTVEDKRKRFAVENPSLQISRVEVDMLYNLQRDIERRVYNTIGKGKTHAICSHLVMN